jgi:hypothetical protein
MSRISNEVRLCYLFILVDGKPMKNWYVDIEGYYVAALKSYEKPTATDTYLLAY